MLLNQVIKKTDESFAVALLGNLINDFISNPVIGSEEMTPLLLSWSCNSFLATALHPTRNQDWQEAYGAFVHKE